MSMDKCPDCGLVVCDVGLYYRADIENYAKKGQARKKDLIQCPQCDNIRPRGEWK